MAYHFEGLTKYSRLNIFLRDIDERVWLTKRLKMSILYTSSTCKISSSLTVRNFSSKARLKKRYTAFWSQHNGLHDKYTYGERQDRVNIKLGAKGVWFSEELGEQKNFYVLTCFGHR